MAGKSRSERRLSAGKWRRDLYMHVLLEKIRRGDIDPSFVVSHRFSLDDAPDAYRMFLEKEDDCTKVVMRP